MFLFAAAAGFTPSVTRAILMQSLIIIAPLFNRRSDGVTSLSFAMLIILIVSPYAITSKSLILSFSSTLGLLTLSPCIYSAITNACDKERGILKYSAVKGVIRFAAASVAASIGGIAFSAPFAAYYFGYVSLIAPITNLVTLWAASLAFCCGLISALIGFVIPAAGPAAASVGALPARFILWIAKLLAGLRYSAVSANDVFVIIWLVFTYLSFGFTALLRSKKRGYAICAALSAVVLIAALVIPSFSAKSEDALYLVDVGQGQCVVLRNADAAAVIDCGSSNGNIDAGEVADAFLRQSGVSKIDVVIISHFDYDHISGITTLLSRFKVGTLICPEPSNDTGSEIVRLATARNCDIIFLTDDDLGQPLVIQFGNAELFALAPMYTDANSSISVLYDCGDWEALITGDNDAAHEYLLCDVYDLPDIEVLVAGHHGSNTSTCDYLLETVTPETALISVGKNTYGHPSEKVVERLWAHGITVYTTLQNGTITQRTGG